MMNKGDRTNGGDIPNDLIEKIDGLMDQFVEIVDDIVVERKLQQGVVRSQHPCSIVVILESTTLYIVGQHHAGVLSTMYTYHPEKEISQQKVMSSARWEFGFEDPFVVMFPKNILDLSNKDRENIVRLIAITFIESEVQRALNLMSLMQIKPLFGHASYMIDDRRACVLVPSTDEGDQIYMEAVRPVLESGGLLVYRAEEFEDDEIGLKTVWNEICRSRIVIADLTDADPQVMYELGIAHTVGKESVLLCKRGKCPTFPESLIKANLIEYDDEGEESMKALRASMATILSKMFKSISD